MHAAYDEQHANANIAFQLNETRMLYDTVLSIQPRVATSKDADAKTPEEIVDDLAALFEEECPPDFPHDQAGFGKDQHAHSLFILQPNGVSRAVCCVRLCARPRL